MRPKGKKSIARNVLPLVTVLACWIVFQLSLPSWIVLPLCHKINSVHWKASSSAEARVPLS